MLAESQGPAVAVEGDVGVVVVALEDGFSPVFFVDVGEIGVGGIVRGFLMRRLVRGDGLFPMQRGGIAGGEGFHGGFVDLIDWFFNGRRVGGVNVLLELPRERLAVLAAIGSWLLEGIHVGTPF